MTLRDEINQRIDENEQELLDSSEKYGGVYIARMEESDGMTLEVELDQGNIAFTITVETAAFLDGMTPEDVYNELKDALEERDISVIEDGDEWDELQACND